MSPESTLLDALNGVGCGGLLLDRSGNVLRCNAVAERYLERHARVQSAKDNGWATGALLALLDGAVRFEGLTTPVVLTKMKRPLIAQRVSLPHAEGQHSGVVLALLDLNEHLRSSPEMLRQVFGLTRSEARLAVRLACGDSLDDIAEVYGIRIGTAREQLKAIFAKTNTCRQAELVALANHLTLISCLSELASILIEVPMNCGKTRCP